MIIKIVFVVHIFRGIEVHLKYIQQKTNLQTIFEYHFQSEV